MHTSEWLEGATLFEVTPPEHEVSSVGSKMDQMEKQCRLPRSGVVKGKVEGEASFGRPVPPCFEFFLSPLKFSLCNHDQ